MRNTLAVAALFALFLSACGVENRTTSEPPSIQPGSGSSGTAMGPGISVAEARRSRLDGPLLVNGYVIAEGSKVRLCEALAESFPPQCGGASLEVRGLDLASLSGVQSSGAVRWSAQPRQLLGEVKNGVLIVSGTSKG